MNRRTHIKVLYLINITTIAWLILGVGIVYADEHSSGLAIGSKSIPSFRFSVSCDYIDPLESTVTAVLTSNLKRLVPASYTEADPYFIHGVSLRRSNSDGDFPQRQGSGMKSHEKMVVPDDTLPGAFRVASSQQDCEEWCRTHRTGAYRCVMCVTRSGCGPGYYPLRSFTGPETNWHACAERVSSEGNRQACEQWCRSHRTGTSSCVKCDTHSRCGTGYKLLRKFAGRGTNWYACAKRTVPVDRRGLVNNREECEAWCKAHRDQCDKCVRATPGCGPGFAKIRSFHRPGDDWQACRERRRPNGNREACQAWCKENPPCSRCTDGQNCGVGYRVLKSFTSGGTNWNACGK